MKGASISAVGRTSRLLRDAKSVRARRAAARILGKGSDPAAIPTLMTALDDDDAGVRLASAEALRRLRAAVAVPRLVLRLQDTHPGVRAAAAQALAWLATADCAEALVKALEDDHWWVVKYSARALTRLSVAAIAPLECLARRADGSGGLTSARRTAMQVLVAIRAPSLQEILLDLSADPEQEVRSEAIRLLGTQSRMTDRAFSRTVELLADSALSVREAAAAALGSHGAPDRPCPPLEGLLSDAEPSVVGAALRSLCRLRVPASAPAVIALLSSADWRVQAEAAQYAGVMRLDAATPRLLEILGERDPCFAYAAARALSNIASAATIDSLIELVAAGDSKSAPAACALRFCGAPEAMAALLTALDSPDQMLRHAAADSLCEIGDPVALPALRRRMEEGDTWVARAAYKWFIARAEPCEELMIRLLKGRDGEVFASVLSECGHPRLERIARRLRERAPLPEERVRWGQAHASPAFPNASRARQGCAP